MATPVVSPIDALHRPNDSPQKLRRTIQQLPNPGGIFAAIPQSEFPVGEHRLDFLFFNDDEIDAFWTFYDAILGSLIPFWVPSFHPDFDLVETVAADDTEILVRSCRYTDLLYPDPNRVDIVFVRPDNTFLKRTVVSSVDNFDGTETLTLNEDLGEVWTQTRANGVCFCWYVRLSDDVARLEYDTASTGECSVIVVEDKAPPSGSGTEAGMP